MPPPPSDPPTALMSLGSSQGGLREYNERVVLQALRLHGPLPAAALARLSGLTAQSLSQIARSLLDQQLICRQAPVRGKVGQPSVPLALNPEGAFAVGVLVGRQTLDLLLVDFTGQPRHRVHVASLRSDPAGVLAALRRRLAELWAVLEPAQRARVVGLGLAAPLSPGGWRGLLGMSDEVARAWQAVDLRAEVQRMVDCPVTFTKDTAAASVAELVAGRGRSVASFLYLFMDTFIGGGLVLDGHLHGGLHGNAGAVGSLPIGLATRGAAPRQLLAVASLHNLEQRYLALALDPAAARDERALQAPWRTATTAWLREAAPAIAMAVQSVACLLDLDAVVLDGVISRPLRDVLEQAIVQALDAHDWEGVDRPRLLAGEVGPDARALGGALLPLHLEFAPDRDLFLKIVSANQTSSGAPAPT